MGSHWKLIVEIEIGTYDAYFHQQVVRASSFFFVDLPPPSPLPHRSFRGKLINFFTSVWMRVCVSAYNLVAAHSHGVYLVSVGSAVFSIFSLANVRRIIII